MKTLIIGVTLSFAFTANAQDVIKFPNADTARVKIIEVGKDIIVYKYWDNMKGSDIRVNKTDVSYIKYENGTVDTFAKYKAPPMIFSYVSQMPQPSVNVGQYLSENLVYPLAAKQSNIEGRVMVKFVVNKDGSLSDVTTTNPKIGYGIEEEAIRVMSQMPKWEPGRNNGDPVNVFFTQPINFRLEDPKK